MWIAFSAGRALRFAVVCVAFGFVAGFLVGVRADSAPAATDPSSSSPTRSASLRTGEGGDDMESHGFVITLLNVIHYFVSWLG